MMQHEIHSSEDLHFQIFQLTMKSTSDYTQHIPFSYFFFLQIASMIILRKWSTIRLIEFSVTCHFQYQWTKKIGNNFVVKHRRITRQCCLCLLFFLNICFVLLIPDHNERGMHACTRPKQSGTRASAFFQTASASFLVSGSSVQRSGYRGARPVQFPLFSGADAGRFLDCARDADARAINGAFCAQRDGQECAVFFFFFGLLTWSGDHT